MGNFVDCGMRDAQRSYVIKSTKRKKITDMGPRKRRARILTPQACRFPRNSMVHNALIGSIGDFLRCPKEFTPTKK